MAQDRRSSLYLVELFYSADQIRVAGGVLEVHIIWKKGGKKHVRLDNAIHLTGTESDQCASPGLMDRNRKTDLRHALTIQHRGDVKGGLEPGSTVILQCLRNSFHSSVAR